MTGRRVVALAAALVALLSLSGCGFHGLYGINLPGGAPSGSAYTVDAVFDNVMDLVPQSAVKLDDVTVGSVSQITLTKDLKARVRMRIADSVHLPATASASIQQTSLLGEKFVQLDRPSGVAAQTSASLRNGSVIPLSRTSTLPDVEQVFGVLATVLNGGGLQKLQTISVELSAALAGRESKVKDLLTQLDTFVSNLDGQKDEIVRALDQLDRFSGTLVQQKQDIVAALDHLGPGLKVLADNRQQLVDLLQGLAKLGDVGTRIIRESKDATIADLQQLEPILTKLNEAGRSLPDTLDLILDYPFPNDVVDAVPGDYTNLYMTLNLNSLCNVLGTGVLESLIKNLPQLPCPSAASTKPGVPAPTPSGGSSQPAPVPLPSLPSLQIPPLTTTPPNSSGGLGGILKGLLS